MYNKNVFIFLSCMMLAGCSNATSSNNVDNFDKANNHLISVGDVYESIDGLKKIGDSDKDKIIKSYNEIYAENQIEDFSFKIKQKNDSADLIQTIQYDSDSRIVFQDISGTEILMGTSVDPTAKVYTLHGDSTIEYDFSKSTFSFPPEKEPHWSIDQNAIDIEESTKSFIPKPVSNETIKNIYQNTANSDYVIEVDFEYVSDIIEKTDDLYMTPYFFRNLSDYSPENSYIYITLDRDCVVKGYYFNLIKDFSNEESDISETFKDSMYGTNLLFKLEFISADDDIELSIPQEAIDAFNKNDNEDNGLKNESENNINNIIEDTELNWNFSCGKVSFPIMNHQKLSYYEEYGFIPIEDFIVEANSIGFVDMETDDNTKFKIMVSNKSSKEKKSSECEIVGFSFDSNGVKDELDFSFAGLKIGMDLNEIKNKIGNETSSYQYSNITILEYIQVDSKWTLTLTIDNECLSKIEMFS